MEHKLNFYVGDITAGEKDGAKVEVVNFTTPAYNPAYNYGTNKNNHFIKFALRCNDGYEARDVTIKAIDSNGYEHTQKVYDHYHLVNPNINSVLNLGTPVSDGAILISKITNVNTIVLFGFASTKVSDVNSDNFNVTFSASYTEVEVV